jgi:hypothetical protein
MGQKDLLEHFAHRGVFRGASLSIAADTMIDTRV